MYQLLLRCFLFLALIGFLEAKNGTSFTVGTVLFSPPDINKECWSQESVALLTTRMLMNNLMPHADKIYADDDSFITDVIEYFRLLLEVIRSNTTGKTKYIMLMAATDTMGGYMKHLIVPISKYAYYAGNVQYSSIIRLYQLYDELKHFLRTNGEGWAKPWKNAGRHIQAKALSMQSPSPTSDPCKGIIYYKKDMGKKNQNVVCGMEVPLPFFDSKTHPAAIAVPFRTFGLRNLESRVSAYIMVKYYVAVSKCMAARNTNDEDVHKFNANIFSFIISKIMPHLSDEKFYAAFGGVLRILQTVTETTKAKGHSLGNLNIMPEMQDREPPDLIDDEEATNKGKNKNGERSRNNLILLAALATIIVWFCLGAAFICCRIKANKMRNDRAIDDDDANACREDTCPAFYDPPSSGGTGTDDGDTKVLYGVKSKSSKEPKPQKPPKPPKQHKVKQKKSKASKEKSGSSKTSKSSKSTPTNKSYTTDSDTHSVISGTVSTGTQPPPKYLTVSSPKETPPPQDTHSPAEPAPQPTPRPSSPRHTTESESATEEKRKSKAELQVHSVQYYPPSFACHTSMTGKVKLESSTDDYTSREEAKQPYVFGYDFRTSSDESEDDDEEPKEQTTDGDYDPQGNTSK